MNSMVSVSAFAAALDAANHDLGCNGIGTLHERTLHLALKYYFAPDPSCHEQSLGGFVADAVTEEGVIEIQTRNLARLKEKLQAFLPLCPVTVVHPICNPKWILWVDENGVIQSKRKSPKKETVYTALRELYGLRDFLTHPNLRIALCETEVEIYRCLNGHGKQKKIHGEHIDRVPIALHHIHSFASPADYMRLLPQTLPTPFTATMLASDCTIAVDDARILINLLRRFSMVEQIGTQNRARLWQYTPLACEIIGG